MIMACFCGREHMILFIYSWCAGNDSGVGLTAGSRFDDDWKCTGTM